jgi:hypothetical protein
VQGACIHESPFTRVNNFYIQDGKRNANLNLLSHGNHTECPQKNGTLGVFDIADM